MSNGRKAMKRLLAIGCLAGLMALSSAAVAQDAGTSESMATSHPAHDNVGIVVNPHIGVLVPQLFSELGTWPIFGLELGYILPFDAGASMIRPLQIGVDVQYTQPSASGDGFSDNLGEDGADFEWELDQQILTVDLSFLWRFMPPAEGLSIYGEVGPRLYMMNSIMTASGNGGADFGENEETNMEYGFFLASGAEYALGPGSLYGALEFGWSDLKQRITGDTNTGALSLDVGYRFMF